MAETRTKEMEAADRAAARGCLRPLEDWEREAIMGNLLSPDLSPVHVIRRYDATVTELRTTLSTLRAERDAAVAELAEIDATFGNVLALSPRWTRVEKIAHMLRVLRSVNAPASPRASHQEGKPA